MIHGEGGEFKSSPKKREKLVPLFLGFLPHFDLKKCLLKKLSPTLLTSFLGYVILNLQRKKGET